MDRCACGCGLPVKVGKRFLPGHGEDATTRKCTISSEQAPRRGKGRTKNALLIDKPAIRSGMRKLSLKGGATRPGRMYWHGEYAATDRTAKERAYQAARASAEALRLVIVDERVE